MNGLTDDWRPEVDWATPAGNLLKSLFAAIPSTTEATITLFGSSQVMWPEIFGREIDVRQEIIAPALERRRQGYQDDLPREDYKAELRRLAEG